MALYSRPRRARALSALLPAAAPLGAVACIDSRSDAVDTSQVARPLRAPDFPALGFEERPDYIPNNVLALSFDDGPDYTNTAKVLDTLRDNDVKATFFINTKNWSEVDTAPEMQALIRRMVDEGHDLGNHTVRHGHLPQMSAADVELEVAGVERTVQNIFGAEAPPVTILRAPFGEPYQTGDEAGLNIVAPVVAQHAIHIGWAIDSADSTTSCRTADCVFQTVTNAAKRPGQGAYGQVLMHSVQAATAEALPRIIDYAKDNGFELWTTEQMVCAAFGASSENVIAGRTGGCADGPGDPPDAGPGGRPDAGTGGQPDAGSGNRPDARMPGPGEPDAGDDPGVDEPGVEGGCGCRTGGDAGGAALALGAVAMLIARRRR